MKTFKQFLLESNKNIFLYGENHRYHGPMIDSSETSMKGIKSAAPFIPSALNKGIFEEGNIIIDYGAGRYGRNAEFLREKGFKVYAYDYTHTLGNDGWSGVSNKLPVDIKFDIGFTSYVLNVIPLYIEDGIIEWMNKNCKKDFHIVRNYDIVKLAISIISSGKAQKSSYWNLFDPNNLYINALDNNLLSIEDVALAYAIFGFTTSKGFQRMPLLTSKYKKIWRNSEKAEQTAYIRQ